MKSFSSYPIRGSLCWRLGCGLTIAVWLAICVSIPNIRCPVKEMNNQTKQQMKKNFHDNIKHENFLEKVMFTWVGWWVFLSGTGPGTLSWRCRAAPEWQGPEQEPPTGRRSTGHFWGSSLRYRGACVNKEQHISILNCKQSTCNHSRLT